MTSSADDTRPPMHPDTPAERVAEATGPADTPPERIPAQSLAVRLKGVIDRTGRYRHRLSDMTAGYSAGQGIGFRDARKAIEETFTAEVGVTPHQYLDRHYALRREESERDDKGPRRPRAFSMDRDR